VTAILSPRKLFDLSTFSVADESTLMMKPNEQEEYELAVQAHLGDRDALSALVERLRLRLFAIAYRDLQHYEDAQDAVASALVRICTHIGDLHDVERFRAWMHAIVRNEAKSLRRQRLTAMAHLSLQDVSELPAPPQFSALRLDVEQALRRLPVDQAHALALFYLGNLSIREIARHTSRPEGTIKSWLHHGRRQLAQSMQEYAPMTPTDPTQWTAAIVSTNLEPAVRNSLADALRGAGYSHVNLFDDYRKVVSTGDFQVLETGMGKAVDFVLPNALKGTQFVILDERIGSRSAFELHLILRAAEKENNVTIAHCILLDALDPPDEETKQISVFASWLTGFDVCFMKPIVPREFEGFARRVREGMTSPSG
jgi:RNA polymerase sigma-70 factor (ECF subfamily)